MSFLKSKTINFDITVSIKWECPHCGKIHITEYAGSPYSAIADDPADEYCDACENFVTLNFFENEEE